MVQKCRCATALLLVGLLLISRPCLAADDAAGSSLERTIEAAEQIDRELAEATKQLKQAPTPTERRRIQARIQELQARQEQLLKELERMVGPLPPAVRSEPPTPLEQQLQSHEKRHDAILESDVGRRLKR